MKKKVEYVELVTSSSTTADIPLTIRATTTTSSSYKIFIKLS